MSFSQMFAWKGERNRPLGMYRPCPCNVCLEARRGVGYLSWSDAKGHGFTMWVESEKVFRMMRRALKAVIIDVEAKLSNQDPFIEADK